MPFAPPDATPAVPTPRRCYRHEWVRGAAEQDSPGPDAIVWYPTVCARCGRRRDETLSRRNKNNGKRGRSDELTVARMLGGRKVGSLGLSHDVEIEGYARIQCKQLDRLPSLSKVIQWLDAIPAGPELRAVTLADTPGPGGRTRRLIVMELADFARWHGRIG